MSEGGEDVYLYVYDISCGMAKVYSQSLIGKQVEGIWHTGVIVYGCEYFYGGSGIQVQTPGNAVGIEPKEKLKLGTTFIPKLVFEEYLNGLGESEFRGDQYKLLEHNCNHFTDTVCNFLIGSGIPEHIVNLPQTILETPFGQLFKGLAENITVNGSTLASLRPRGQSPEFHQLNQDIEVARLQSLALRERRNEIKLKLEKRERKKNKKRRKEAESNISSRMSDTSESADAAPIRNEVDASVQLAENLADEERREREERKKNREPPIVFKDAVDIHIEFDALVGLIDGKLNEEEQQSLEELHQYMLQDEGSWALGDSFLVFIGRLLTDTSLSDEVSLRCLNVLAAAALKDDVILMLHQDRRQHILMNYAYNVDRLPLPQQRSLTLFICNLFENIGSSEWLLYISEWAFNNNQISNIRVTTKVAVNALLSEDEEMKDRGTAVLYNLATKEVFDDVAVELTMAILQFLNGSPTEAQLFRCLTSLLRFCHISAQDVPQLVQMIGPHPSKFKGNSERNDKLIEEISRKIR